MKPKKETKFTIFDHWANLTTKKEGYKETDDEFVSSYNPYMMNRMLSMLSVYLPLAADISRYDLPKETHHRLLDGILPKKYLKFDYLKKKKDESSKDDKLIQEYFEFGSRDLEVAKKFLSEDNIVTLKKMYGKIDK